MKLEGYCYPPESSARRTAELHLEGTAFKLLCEGSTDISGEAHALQFSQRVGNIPRKITLPDGSIFETTQNRGVDAWLDVSDHRDEKAHWMHAMESNWRWIVTALLVTVALLVAAGKWGLPWVSTQIAYQLPVEANLALAEGTLKTMDQLMLEHSELPKERQQAIREHFQKTLLPLDKEGFTYTLHFRKWDDVANAFALPSGDIVVTDKLAELVTIPEEIDSILLHEIGHVVHRHSMRQVIQSSAMTIAMVMFTGDASAMDEWTAALPAVLLQSHYSRDFESEADRYAFARMIQLNIDPAHFGRGLQRITDDAMQSSPLSKKDTQRTETFLKYFSSHPPSDERAAVAKQFSAQFQAQHPANPPVKE